MYHDHRILALIPARGGSKGIPQKNVKLLHGHPLIAYTVAAGFNSSYIDDVVVTTDSEEIAEVARRYGAKVPFMRPAELATDTSKSIEAIMHALAALSDLGCRYDSIVLLQPTSPLRSAKEIDGAIETFYSHGCLGVASVSEVSENPVLTRRIDSEGVLHPLLPIDSTVRRQDMPKFYHVNGAIYINKTSSISLNTSLNDNPIAYRISADSSIDIDCINDFFKAEEALKRLETFEVEKIERMSSVKEMRTQSC